MTINPQKSNNPFQILDLPARFSTTHDQIQRAYLQKLASSHPDLAGDTPEAASESTSERALDPATLNTARDTLLNDESRANLMLDLVGGPPPSNHTLPDGFLMEMMELRTQIEEELDPESEDAHEARSRWQTWANDRRTETITHIAGLFTQLDNAGDHQSEQIKLDIRTNLNAWRYTQRLIEQLDPTYDPSSADF